MSDPNYVTGSFNYYYADRDPTDTEPLIIPGLLMPSQILFWKNTVSGNIFFLSKYTSDNPKILTWVKIAYTLDY